MPQELIYTSAARGLKTGASGFCAVAMTEGMSEALAGRLEQISYYRHLRLSGGTDRPIFCYRHIEARGQRYRVLTRLADTGADFTGRTNFIAHHLVFRPEEVIALAPKNQRVRTPIPSPAELALFWPGWRTGWSEEPTLLTPLGTEEFIGLSKPLLPCDAWRKLTGQGRDGWSLLEPASAGGPVDVGRIEETELLLLVAESLQLLEEREPAKWWHGSAWNRTFTTLLQEEDEPSDFLLRFVRAGGRAPKALERLRATHCTETEIAFAERESQPLRARILPHEASCVAGHRIALQVEAEGLPSPKTIRWLLPNGELAGSETRLDHTAAMGENRLRCEVSNFRESWSGEAVFEGRRPVDVSLAVASWTDLDRMEFAKRFNELDEKNPEIYSLSMSADLLFEEPLEQSWIESRVADGTLTRRQLDACFKALYYCGEKKKQAVVRETLDRFDAIRAGKGGRRRRRELPEWVHLAGGFAAAAALLLGSYYWSEIKAFMGFENGEKMAEITPAAAPEMDPDLAGLRDGNPPPEPPPQSSGLQPGPREGLLIRARYVALPNGGKRYAFPTNDALLPDALVDFVRPAEVDKQLVPEALPWDVQRDGNVLRIQSVDPLVRPPQMLVLQDDKLRLHALFEAVDGVTLRFQLVGPRGEPADEHTRIWMDLLTKYYGRGVSPGIMRVGKGEDESLRSISEIPIRLKDGLQGDLLNLNDAVRFYTRKFDFLDVAGSMWALLDPANRDDAVLIELLGGHQEMWSKYGKEPMKRRECQQVADDLYVILRYRERPRQGRAQIEAFQRHNEATRTRWLRADGRLPAERRHAGELLRLWRELENLGRYRRVSQVAGYLADWSVGSEDVLSLSARTPGGEINLGGGDKRPWDSNIRFGEFREQAGEMKKKIGPRAARISGVASLREIGKFNLLLESR